MSKAEIDAAYAAGKAKLDAAMAAKGAQPPKGRRLSIDRLRKEPRSGGVLRFGRLSPRPRGSRGHVRILPNSASGNAGRTSTQNAINGAT